MKNLFTLILIFAFAQVFAAKPKHQYVKIATSKGDCIVMLYDQTPLHRDNFLKLAKEGFFNGTLFHRVIKDFMIQGGDPTSKNAKPGAMLGDGGPKYTIPAEFNDSLFHKKGVLAAAREGDAVNPKKASSGSQFYLVQGKVYNDDQLNSLANQRSNGISIEQRNIYKTIGGTPFLDTKYTVFGEIVKGLEMVDAIANEATGLANRPVKDVAMTVTVLKKREAKKLEKELIKVVKGS
jgi:cyclophilin family peptidyl-prolyl cis-trans isomerase